MVVFLAAVFKPYRPAPDKTGIMAGGRLAEGLSGFVMVGDFGRIDADVAHETSVGEQNGISIDNRFHPVNFASRQNGWKKRRPEDKESRSCPPDEIMFQSIDGLILYEHTVFQKISGGTGKRHSASRPQTLIAARSSMAGRPPRSSGMNPRVSDQTRSSSMQ